MIIQCFEILLPCMYGCIKYLLLQVSRSKGMMRASTFNPLKIVHISEFFILTPPSSQAQLQKSCNFHAWVSRFSDQVGHSVSLKLFVIKPLHYSLLKGLRGPWSKFQNFVHFSSFQNVLSDGFNGSLNNCSTTIPMEILGKCSCSSLRRM